MGAIEEEISRSEVRTNEIGLATVERTAGSVGTIQQAEAARGRNGGPVTGRGECRTEMAPGRPLDTRVAAVCWTGAVPDRLAAARTKGALRWGARRQGAAGVDTAGAGERRGLRGKKVEERAAGWNWRNEENNNWNVSTDLMEFSDGEGPYSLSENRRREGEVDGNTIYWEYKKG